MSLINRAIYMILTPKTEWEVIASEEPDADAIFMRYALPLIIASAAVAFIGHFFIWDGGFIGTDELFFRGIDYGFRTALIGALGVCLSALAVNALAKKFGAEKNMGRSMQLVTYAMTPALLSGLAMIYPPIGIICLLFGLYGLYLLYLGLPQMMKTSQDNIVSYRAISIVSVLAIYIALIFISKIIFWDVIIYALTNIQINSHPLH